MRIHLIITSLILLPLATLCGCSNTKTKQNAGILTTKNFEQLSLQGPMAQGAPGDYFIRNDYLTAIIERPGRVFGPGPYGGNIIDLGRNDLREDNLGETIPFFQFGLTAEFESVRVVSDGSDGSAAVIEAIGYDNLWDYVNIQSFMPELLSYKVDEEGEPTGLLKFNPTADLPLQIRARYTLAPEAKSLEVRYYLRNLAQEPVQLHAAFGVDMRGAVEPFVTGRGFSDPGVDLDNIEQLLGGEVNQPFIAYQTATHSIGVRSVDFLEESEVPRMSVGVVGVALFFLGSKNLLEFLSSPGTLELPGGTEKGFGFDLFLGDDVNDVHEWSLADESWGEIKGTLQETSSGTPIGQARIAALNAENGDIESAFQTDADGKFSGRLPAGDYHLVADDLTRSPDSGRMVTITSAQQTESTIELSSQATLQINIQSANDINSDSLEYSPCRVLLFSDALSRKGGLCENAAICTDNEPFRHYKKWEMGGNTPYSQHLRYCNTAMAPDEPLKVVPGRYLAFISRGPEYNTLQEIIDLSDGSTKTMSGILRRAVDSTALVASDYHVHQIASTDSVVSFEDRVLGFASNGIDFFVTTDHDAISDLRPIVADLELQNTLNTLPGSEVSTIDLGHFNGWPLEPAQDKNFGDPVDWAGGRNRPNPGQLFDLMRERGAQVVQVNHPRSSSSYLQKLGVLYDFDKNSIQEDVSKAPPPEVMHMDTSLPLFATNFDAIEIFNGVRFSDAEKVKKDWFNFLSMGLKVIGTSVSDSHNAYTRNPGDPRTYVHLDNDAAAAFDSAAYIENFLDGKAFMSSAPILRLLLKDSKASATMGETLSSTETLTLDIEVQTPSWYKVNTLNIYLNKTFIDPGASNGDTNYEAIAPNLTTGLLPEVVQWPNGATGYRYTTEVTLDESILNNEDTWLVVEAIGSDTLYPVSLSSGSATIDSNASSIEEFLTIHGGATPFALSNPIFIDRDGDGSFVAKYAMQSAP